MKADWSPELDITPRPGEPTVDTWAAQIAELAAIRHPGPPASADDLAALGAAVGAVWVRYPWRGVAVRLLPAAPFREVRLARNRYKILADEQAHLLGRHIGIVGLSVGRSAAITLVMAGIGGRFRIADPDTLGLSNLNRLAGSVADLGASKAILCARAMMELDPYLSLEVWEAGVAPGDTERFVEGLDLLVEECDHFPVKGLLRRAARTRRVPVVMDTSDRGLLDIERYDRGEAHPGLAMLLAGADAPPPPDLATALASVATLLGVTTLSARAAAAVLDHPILGGWPQTAPDVVLGGALVAEAARTILLGGPDGGPASGRRWVDLRALLGDPAPAAPVGDGSPPPAPAAADLQVPEDRLADIWARCAPVWRAAALDAGGTALWSAGPGPETPLGTLRRLASRPDVRDILRRADGGALVAALAAGGVGIPRQLWLAQGEEPPHAPGWLPLCTDAASPLTAETRAMLDALARWLADTLDLTNAPCAVLARF